MIDPVLFELAYKGEQWRFTLSSYGGGPRRLNVRAFWQNPTGEWCPSRKGFTMPLEAMQGLGEALTAASRQIAANGAPSAS